MTDTSDWQKKKNTPCYYFLPLTLTMRTKTAEKPLCDADAKCDSTLIYLQQIKRSEEKYI